MFFPSQAQAGDTIVEVIIAIAVVSSLLIGAYGVTIHSSKDIRDSEEHAQALQLLQGQVELLRSVAISGQLRAAAGAGTNLGSPFCLDQAAVIHQPPASCAGAAGSPVPYALSIACQAGKPCPNPASATTTFTLSTTWPAVTGGNAAVGLTYKVSVQ